MAAAACGHPDRGRPFGGRTWTLSVGCGAPGPVTLALGPAARARNGLRRRLHLVPGSAADARLATAMGELLSDWGDGVLGPADRRPVKLGVVHWRPPGVVLTS